MARVQIVGTVAALGTIRTVLLHKVLTSNVQSVILPQDGLLSHVEPMGPRCGHDYHSEANGRSGQ